jgi:hypothetical protein
MSNFNAAEYFQKEGLSISSIGIMEAANSKSTDLGKRYSKRNPNYTWMKSMFGGEYNPDKLDYRVYNNMLKDPQIQTAYRLISYTLRSKKFVVTPASQDPLDVEIADFIRKGLENLRTPMRQVRGDQLTAMKYGYAVGECVFKLNNRGMIDLDAIYSLPISSIVDCFEYDDNGELITVWQNTSTGSPIQIPANKCLINTFDEEFANKYGRSILNQLYDAHFLKSNFEKWRAGYLDSLERPPVIAESDAVDEVQKILDDMHGEGVNGVVPPGTKINLIESSHRGEGFDRAIEYYDTVIFRAFMIGSLLLGQSQSQGGSLAQSITHSEIFQLFGDGVHEDSAIPWQELIKTWVDFNYNTEEYPKFSFEPLTMKDLLGLIEKLQPLADKFAATTKELGYDLLIPMILREYADIEVEHEDNPKPTENQIVPTTEEINTPQTEDHNSIITNVMSTVPPKE